MPAHFFYTHLFVSPNYLQIVTRFRDGEMRTFFLLVLALFCAVFSQKSDSLSRVLEHAIWQTGVTVGYDPSYQKLNYPAGDVPLETGVCTDVIIRAFRAAGIDLQVLIHEDMKAHFANYPQIWGLERPDRNIDHRRVPNIATYMQRIGKKLAVSKKGSEYIPGDLVTWKLPGNLDHIGIVVNVKVKGTDRFMVVHNIGQGARMEDVMFAYEITGHYRYWKKE